MTIYYDMDTNPVVPELAFGPKDHQKMRIDRAEVLLTWLFEHRSHVFRSGMCVAYDLDIPAEHERKPRGKAAQS